MSQKPTSTTTLFKLIYFAFISIISIVVIAGSFFMLDDPRFKTPSLVTNVKRLYYQTSFLVANATGATTSDTDTEQSPAHLVPVLAYHGVLPDPDGSTINFTETQFKDQMFALRRAGYTSITLSDLDAFAREGKALPAHPILITFDDGRADSYYNADPILDAVGYSAAIFVITDYAQSAQPGGYYLTTDEIKHIASTGRWDIGSHSADGHDEKKIDENKTLGNFFSSLLWIENEHRIETDEEFRSRILRDFQRSQQYLQELLGTRVLGFAFPFGDIGQNQPNAREKMKEIEDTASQFYQMLFYQQSPGEYFTQFSGETKTDTALLIRRIDMQNSWDAQQLLDMLSDGSEKKLPYHDTFENDNGWLKTWGRRTIENNTLVLRAATSSSGASAILDGSQLWTNYAVTAKVLSPNRTGILIWTRFVNDYTQAACNFGVDFVHIEQTLQGEKRVLKGVQRPNSIPEGSFTVSAHVQGRALSCSINGIEIVRTEFLDPSLTHGGTGFKVWDKVLGKSVTIIQELDVQPSKSEE